MESWLEGMGPHSAGIRTTVSPYLGLHIYLDSTACLFDHDQIPGSIRSSGHCRQETSVLLSHYQPLGVCFQHLNKPPIYST